MAEVSANARGATDVGEEHYRRGTLEPVWGRLQEHEHDIRELYRTSAQAHERVNATNETIMHLREDIRDWKDQTHKDSTSILGELRKANVRAAEIDAAHAAAEGRADGRWETFKVGVPIALTTSGMMIAGLVALYQFGLIG